MHQKPRAGSGEESAAPKPKKEKSQKQQFIEAARKVGVDETGEEFERAIRQIVPRKKARQSTG